jgi:hypothetical protein
MYEDTYIVWKGIAKQDEAISVAIDIVDDKKLRGAWVIKGIGREIIAKIHRDKYGIEVTKY